MKLLSVVLLSALAVVGCTSTSQYRACQLDHPYHQAKAYDDIIVPTDLNEPRTRSTFNVPAETEVAAKPSDLATAEDQENLTSEQLAQKRCIMVPPSLVEPAA